MFSFGIFQVKIYASCVVKLTATSFVKLSLTLSCIVDCFLFCAFVKLAVYMKPDSYPRVPIYHTYFSLLGSHELQKQGWHAVLLCVSSECLGQCPAHIVCLKIFNKQSCIWMFILPGCCRACFMFCNYRLSLCLSSHLSNKWWLLGGKYNLPTTFFSLISWTKHQISIAAKKTKTKTPKDY